jgi:hypothetical protein
MSRIRSLAVPAYLMAALLVLFPLGDTLLTVWPLRLGTVSWRFGAVGIFSRAMMTPLLGLLLALAVAALAKHSRARRGIALLAGLQALVLLIVIPLFALDTLQMRSQVRPEALAGVDVASTIAATKLLLTAVVAAALCAAGVRRTRWDAQRSGRVRRAAGAGRHIPLVFTSAGTRS